MRKYHEVLTAAYKDKWVGNHSVRFQRWAYYYDEKEGGKEKRLAAITRVFNYHGNTICVVDDNRKEFWLSHAGYFTRSTKEALAGYRQIFCDKGYKNMTPIAVYAYEKSGGTL